MGQLTRQVVVVDQATMDPNRFSEQLALFSPAGVPIAAITFDETPEGADVLLTGYEIAEADADLEATDTVNEAFGKLEFRLDALETSETGEVDTAAEVRATVLTGLSVVDATAVVAGDSLLVAIGKLQAQITAL